MSGERSDQPQSDNGVDPHVAQTELEHAAARRAADHAAIAGSIDDLLPTLIAKLGATGLAELEVRQDGLRVRLRRPADGIVTHDRRATDRGRGDRVRTIAPPPPAAGPGAAPASVAYNVGLTAVGPGRDIRDGREVRVGGELRELPASDEPRAVATSPAVGIYHPRTEARAGTRVRAGDRLGTVDMLGVPQEVVAPADGLVGASLVDSGEAVEYGQELVVIEFATASSSSGTSTPGSGTSTPGSADH
jgi:biotin carboxyl carrier protein